MFILNKWRHLCTEHEIEAIQWRHLGSVVRSARYRPLVSSATYIQTQNLDNVGFGSLGRDDFRFFWNFITAIQILPCVIETQRYGYIRDSGSRVETPHRATIGCEKFYNGCFHCCGHF